MPPLAHDGSWSAKAWAMTPYPAVFA
jgi:hypothetical protein